MAVRPDGIIGKLLHRRAMARWAKAARAASGAELAALRAFRQQARQLRVPLQELTHIADTRLALPRIGSNTFARPAGTDWAWRPQLWRGPLPEKGVAPAQNKDKLGRDLTIFHDCKAGEIAVRQVRNTRDDDLAAFGVAMDVFSFTGQFLSLVVEMPADVCKGLQKRHLIRLNASVDREKPVKMFARLNIKNGPNTEQVLLALPDETEESFVEFDLAFSSLNENRIERMWLDLMVEHPHMNKITLRDLTFCRFPRAEI